MTGFSLLIECRFYVLYSFSFRGATHSVSINEGLDQEMPYGDYFENGIPSGLADGSVTDEKIDDSVTRILVPM